MQLRGDRFDGYFHALHGYDPFPWQRRLAAWVLDRGRWPALLDIPTGLGKTSAIDVALFALAARPEIAPRRIVLVVDRRVVVDQAAEHARKIQAKLTAAHDGPLHLVATALRNLWQGGEADRPFEVAVLRGGMPRDEAWAHRPDRPVVALSTVDQVGSRLLFRGYGVSPGMAPIHAGLLGHDALILLDEVQLSTAFAETLTALDERWRTWRERDHGNRSDVAVPNRWAFVRMSATPVGSPVPDDQRLSLDDDDLSHPIVHCRRSAHKKAELLKPMDTVKGDPDRSLSAVVRAFSQATIAHVKAGARRVAVIVNRVLAAREIEKELAVQLRERADVVLLTGRMRPLDREAIFGEVSDPDSVAARVTAGAQRAPDHRPVVVVATQTIEAGADFDFDALVTECASIDALRQRFGRLDRRGEQRKTRATVLVRKDQAAGSDDDPIYGAALAKTWAWLESRAGDDRTVDFGIAYLPQPPEDLCVSPEHAPVMFPAHLDALAQTNPRGEPDPDVALWLHGRQRGLPEVRVVWRADIDAAELADERKTKDVKAYAAVSFGVAPPSSLEAISVALPALRAWLDRDRGPEADIADIEGTVVTDASRRPDATTSSLPVLVVDRKAVRVVRSSAEIPPESTIVVPSSYGGVYRGNWDPDATEPVTDLGDRAQFVHRGRAVLRLVPEVLAGVSAPSEAVQGTPHVAEEESTRSSAWPLSARHAAEVPTVPRQDDPEFDPRDAIREWILEVQEHARSDWRAIAAATDAANGKAKIVQLGESRYFAVIGTRRVQNAERELTSDVVGDDDDSASYLGQEVSLEAHLGDVERWAANFVNNLGVPPRLAQDLSLAARLHDLGKVDPRFQQMLHGGSAVRAAASAHPLAKSRRESWDAAARKQARALSGYPRGYRHELLSVALLEAAPKLLERANDRELVLHLVGSHHGWCRPFAPATDHGPHFEVEWTFDSVALRADAAHGLGDAGSDVAARYFRLTERYGWWTLAWLETIVRLADHRASEEEAAQGSPATKASTASGAEMGRAMKCSDPKRW